MECDEWARTTRFWKQDEDEDQQSLEPCAQVARWTASCTLWPNESPWKRWRPKVPVCSLLLGPRKDNTKTSWQIWMTRCGKICQMIGKKICLKRKKVPPCENVRVSRKSASTDTAIPFETSGNLKMSCIIDGRTCGDKEKRELFSCSVCTNTMSGEAGRYVWRSLNEDVTNPLAALYRADWSNLL